MLDFMTKLLEPKKGKIALSFGITGHLEEIAQ